MSKLEGRHDKSIKNDYERFLELQLRQWEIRALGSGPYTFPCSLLPKCMPRTNIDLL